MQKLFGKDQLEPVTVYVMRDEADISARDVADLMGYLIHQIPVHVGITPPDFPCITERQFKRLPEHLQSFYQAREFLPQWRA